MSVHLNHLKHLLKSKFNLSIMTYFHVISISNHNYDVMSCIYGFQLASSVFTAYKKQFKQ